MSLFKRNNNNLLSDPFFNDDFENEFFNHPLIPFPSTYPYFHHPMERLEKQLSKAFDHDVFKSVDFSPKVNLGEDENNYYIHADLPGLSKDQVKMELSEDNRMLTISGERETIIKDPNNDNEEDKDEQKKDKKDDEKKENKKDNNDTKKYSRIECSYGKFSRSFTLPENANIDNIQAKMENGTLEVILPKIEPSKQKQRKTIQIQ